MILMDGKVVAEKITSELAETVRTIREKDGRAPKLAVVLVGNDPGSQIYVRNKEKACAKTGIKSKVWSMPATVTQEELEELLKALNEAQNTDGILLQLPLPKGLDAQACLNLINPAKDVDGFHPVNMGRLALGLPGIRPCTPAGIMRLLKYYDIQVPGKRAVIVGRSNIVGKPLSLMLAAQNDDANATVTIAHSRTKDLPGLCREADILAVAIGRAKFITKSMVKPGAVVIDVGMNHFEGKLCGDVDFEAVKEIVQAITPVPGGVGPMTIAMLMHNTVEVYLARNRGK